MSGRGFPRGFVWGAASAAYQVEGAVHEDGRGESIWDRFSHTPGCVRGGDTGDIACDHYRRYREDVALIAGLGLGAYRFSIAWPRVIPDGVGAVNEKGLDFYDRLIDELRDHGIAPYVTLYHWDLPQALEDAGGWPVRRTAELFARYAEVVARRIGDRVESMATLNEPWCSAHLGYRLGIHAPGRTSSADALAASHHLLVAHGLAIQAIRAASPATPAGIVLNFEPQRPATPHILDVEAAALADEQMNRWYLDPVMGRPYPADAVRAWGWTQAEVAPADMELIAEPLDFLGVNYYTCRTVRAASLPILAGDRAPERTAMGWPVEPAGLTEVLESIHARTGDLPLFVTENGAAYEPDPADPGRDPERVSYFRRHVDAAREAIDAGVPLKGYFAWSLMDNFEWHDGYSYRFGLVHVDFDTQARVVRDSGRYVGSLAGGMDPGVA